MSKNPNSEPLVNKIDGDLASPFVRKINLHEVNKLVSDIEGKILTVVDASIVEKRQCEAIKSLIRQLLWKDFDLVRDWYYQQFEGQGSNFPIMEAVAVDR